MDQSDAGIPSLAKFASAKTVGEASEVDQAFAYLDDGLSLILHQIDRTRERLEPVLQPEALTDTAGVGTFIERPLSPVATRLRTFAGYAHAYADRLSEMTDRLDV